MKNGVKQFVIVIQLVAMVLAAFEFYMERYNIAACLIFFATVLQIFVEMLIPVSQEIGDEE